MEKLATVKLTAMGICGFLNRVFKIFQISKKYKDDLCADKIYMENFVKAKT